MKEINQRDQLSHRNTNIIYMMSTGFSIDIKSSAERYKKANRGACRGRWRKRKIEREEDTEGARV